jgi:hypothetical protein
MPSNNRLRADDRNGANNGRKQPTQPDKDQSVEPTQHQSLWHLAAENADLVAKNEDLGFKPRPRFESRRYQSEQQEN